jgi:hypothetical protein
MKLSVNTVDVFPHTMEASMAHGGCRSSKVVTDASQAAVSRNNSGLFQSGHRSDASKWMKLKGGHILWLCVSRQWVCVSLQWLITASIDGVSCVIDNLLPIPNAGPGYLYLYEDQSHCMYNAM